jgi:hypothetical protein
MNSLTVNASAARRLFHVLQPSRRLFGPCLPRGKGTAGQRKGGRNVHCFRKNGSSGCWSRQVGMMHSYIRGWDANN